MQKKIKLPDPIIDQLISLPESGMGYQNVTFILKDGRKLTNRTVINSEFLLLNEHEKLQTADFQKGQFMVSK